MTFRSKKLTDSAADSCCIRCGRTGETRACHYNGYRAHSYGKGRGEKCSDLMTAELCHKCDDIFSEANYPLWPGGSKSIERSEEFMHLIAMTNLRRIQAGVLVVR